MRAAGRRTTAVTAQPGRAHPIRGPRLSSSTISSTVTIEVLAREHRLLLHAGDPPHPDVAPGVRLLCMDDRHIGIEGRTAASSSSENGLLIGATVVRPMSSEP